MSELPPTLRCPRGDEWPVNLIQCLVDLRATIQTYDTITFLCPAGHKFTLGTAVKAKTFTPDQAETIIASAILTVARARYGDP